MFDFGIVPRILKHFITVQLIWEGKCIYLRQSKINSINVNKYPGGTKVDEENQLEESKKGFLEEVLFKYNVKVSNRARIGQSEEGQDDTLLSCV